MCLTIDEQCHKGRIKKYKVSKGKIIHCYKIMYFSKTYNKLISPFLGVSTIIKDKFFIKSDYFQEVPRDIKYLPWNSLVNAGKLEDCSFIDNGIHAYTDLLYALGKLREFNNKKYLSEELEPVLICCSITKGTKYWIGIDHEICAEKLYVNTTVKALYNKAGKLKYISN